MKKIICTIIFAATAYSLPVQADVNIDLSKPSQPKSEQTTILKKDISRLFELLAKAQDEKQARKIENEIWQNWMIQPDEAIQKLVKKAMEARRWYDFAKARKLLNQVIEKAPQYAEGWNQRAFILFLQEKFDEALSDTERALELEPRHFGAMAGQAQILMRQGRFNTAQKILKQAVKIHPFLRERSMILETDDRKL